LFPSLAFTPEFPIRFETEEEPMEVAAAATTDDEILKLHPDAKDMESLDAQTTNHESPEQGEEEKQMRW
jgi:hypothetical protein